MEKSGFCFCLGLPSTNFQFVVFYLHTTSLYYNPDFPKKNLYFQIAIPLDIEPKMNVYKI